MFNRLAGIDHDGPGFQRILIRPSPPTPDGPSEPAPIHWVKAHYDSIHGRIVSHWRRSADRFALETTIPANTSATVYLPVKSAETVFESGRPLNKAPGVRWLRMEGDRAVLAVEAGNYRFESRW